MYKQLNYQGPSSLESRVKAYIARGSEKSGMKKMAFVAKLLEKAIDQDIMGVYTPAKKSK